MKKVILSIALTTAVVGALGQGQITFGNRVTTATPAIDAPVTVFGTGEKLGSTYVCGILIGTSADNLQPAKTGGAEITSPFRTSATTGLGLGYLASTTPSLDGYAVNAKVYVQLVAWQSASGASYSAALAKWVDPSSQSLMGWSNVMSVTVGGDTVPPTQLVELKPWSIVAVPEPTVLALGALGGVAFLLRRRS